MHRRDVTGLRPHEPCTVLDWIDRGFYFLRHGESEHNRLDRVNGWTDSALTDRGEAQARAAAHRLATYPIHRIVTSDLQRARRTADIVAETRGAIEVEVFPGLRERHWGCYEDGPRSLRPALDEVPEGGEGPDDYYRRVVGTLALIRPDSRTLIVAHAGSLRVLKRLLAVEDQDARVENAVPLYVRLAVPTRIETL
ncbi:MAG: hypothetical protein RLZZ63_630 [Gemmatimonadota bacterium]|jgi:probable phosphoglycerate mutase